MKGPGHEHGAAPVGHPTKLGERSCQTPLPCCFENFSHGAVIGAANEGVALDLAGFSARVSWESRAGLVVSGSPMSSGQMSCQSFGKRVFRLAIPRASATGASRISLSSGIRLFAFHSDTEGGLTLVRSATTEVPPN